MSNAVNEIVPEELLGLYWDVWEARTARGWVVTDDAFSDEYRVPLDGFATFAEFAKFSHEVSANGGGVELS